MQWYVSSNLLYAGTIIDTSGFSNLGNEKEGKDESGDYEKEVKDESEEDDDFDDDFEDSYDD